MAVKYAKSTLPAKSAKIRAEKNGQVLEHRRLIYENGPLKDENWLYLRPIFTDFRRFFSGTYFSAPDLEKLM